jgi:hypothetical protein
MIYVSLDLETTCLAPRKPENILGISMVIEDTTKAHIPLMELPHFTCMVAHEEVTGSPYALALNGWILLEIENFMKGKPTKYPVYLPPRNDSHQMYYADPNGLSYPADTWIFYAHMFLNKHFGKDRINVAGKNVAGFDMQFLPPSLQGRFRNRVIDAGSVGVDWTKRELPNLSQLKERAGIGSVVSHNMHEDALDVIAFNRTTYPKTGALLEQWERAELARLLAKYPDARTV